MIEGASPLTGQGEGYQQRVRDDALGGMRRDEKRQRLLGTIEESEIVLIVQAADGAEDIDHRHRAGMKQDGHGLASGRD
jgi:hypothetical protein